jgi:hypothetical protein
MAGHECVPVVVRPVRGCLEPNDPGWTRVARAVEHQELRSAVPRVEKAIVSSR